MEKEQALKLIQEKAREHAKDEGKSFSDWFFVLQTCALALGQNLCAKEGLEWAQRMLEQMACEK